MPGSVSGWNVKLKGKEKHERVLVIACGALAREIDALAQANGWRHVVVHAVPAEFHNTPARIPEAVRVRIQSARGKFDHIFCAYADCGTGGRLDSVLAEEGVERIPGAHCYQFFAGTQLFDELSREEPGTFYLTDFLAEHFDRLVIRGLGLDRHPELYTDYFGKYERLVYLSQTTNPELMLRARAAAERLGLAFEHRHTGYGGLAASLAEVAVP
jgi:hypothetical protein